MSTVIENANRRVNEATASLRKAEERLNNFMDANPTDFTSAGFLTLSAQVTACRAIVEGAQQALVELTKQRTAQIIVERDLLLNRTPTLATMFPLSPPSTHPSEHSLTKIERAERRKLRTDERKKKSLYNAGLKSETVLFYYGQPQTETIKDMLTNFDFPIHDVHRSHIFQASWDEGKFTELILAGGLEFRDITKDSPENMLLLHDNVETKFDCGQLLIEYDESSGNFICRILDKKIADEFICLKPQPVTFGQYHGKPLHFPSDSIPFRRLIRFRAIVNRLVAIDRGYIEAEDYKYLMNSDDWSPGTKALFESIIDWNSKIPTDSHLYVNTALLQD